MFNAIRFWFIKLLVGKSTIVLNAHIGGDALLTVKAGGHALVYRCVFEPLRMPATISERQSAHQRRANKR